MRVRWDSPFVLAVAGTVAIHLVALTAGDALVVTHPPAVWRPAPHVELVEVEVPPVLKPPPPPPPPPPAPEPPAPVEPVKPAPRAQAVRAAPVPARSTPEPPPTPTETPAPSGGDPVVHMDDIAPAATGVGVAVGRPATGRVGRGGSDGGTGAGSGSGTADELKPVSVATIKTNAQPKGDYDYINLGKDYPAEARDLRIEGKIQVLIIIDERGKVVSQRLLNRLGHGLDELALQYASRLTFEPARDTEDRPVASQLTWTFHMNAPK